MKKELEDAKKEFDEQIADAEEKLQEAKDDLKKLERPEWYVLDRDMNTGYASLCTRVQIELQVLAEVFPVVFFLVAALISLTSMNRMVEEGKSSNRYIKGTRI